MNLNEFLHTAPLNSTQLNSHFPICQTIYLNTSFQAHTSFIVELILAVCTEPHVFLIPESALSYYPVYSVIDPLLSNKHGTLTFRPESKDKVSST